MSVLQTIIIVILSSVIVAADPNCTTYGESIVCTPGDTDYVLKRGLVSDNNNTISIALIECRITDLDKGSFKNLFSLKYLDLSRNMISNITMEHLDESLPDLIHLNLSYNRLTILPARALFWMPNIEVLALKGNKLTDIAIESISELHNLKYIDISDNSFIASNLHPELFQLRRKIQHFDMSGNDASTIVLMPRNFFFWGEKLETLHLDRCNLPIVSNVLFSSLKTVKSLSLSANRVNRIPSDSFKPLFNLEILDLSENIINIIEDNAFENNEKLKTIILRNNKLKVISENVFRALPRLANLDLSYNLIEDVPVNAFRASPLRNFNLAGNRFTYLNDNFCLELRNSRATLRKFFFNQNPWQCACLNNILAEVKKYEIDYNDAKYNGVEPVCVVGERFTCERQQSENERYSEIYDRIIEQYLVSTKGAVHN